MLRSVFGVGIGRCQGRGAIPYDKSNGLYVPTASAAAAAAAASAAVATAYQRVLELCAKFDQWAEVDELLALGLQRHSPSQAQPIEAEGACERGFGPVLGRDGLAAREPAHDLCGRPARRYRWCAPLGVHERSRTAPPWRVQAECTYAGHLVAKRRAEAAEATHQSEGGGAGAGAGEHWLGGPASPRAPPPPAPPPPSPPPVPSPPRRRVRARAWTSRAWVR